MLFYLTWTPRIVSRFVQQTIKPAFLLSASICLTVIAIGPANLEAQSEKSKTATYVKIQATAGKPDNTGYQKVTVALDIDKKYFLIGNDVPEVLDSARL